MRPSMQEWHSFTAIWMANVRHLGRDANYCRLALAMSRSDEGRRAYEGYIELAIRCKRHFDEMEDRRLLRRKADAEARNWTFSYNGYGWKAEEPPIIVHEVTLRQTLDGIEQWGIPLRQQWEEIRRR